MSVVAFRGRDTASDARALLNGVLSHGDIIGTDDQGRTVVLLMLDRWTLDRLLTFDDAAADDEAEPDQELDGPAVVLDFVPLKRLSKLSRFAQAVALALLFVTAPQIDAAGASQAAVHGAAADVDSADAATVLPDVPQGSGMRRRLHQRREAVPKGFRLRVLGRERLLTALPVSAIPSAPEHHENIASVDHRSFRDLLLFDIGFAIDRNRALLRRLLKEHVSDDTRQQLAKKVVEQLELSGFEIDEADQVMRRRPPLGHG